MRNRILRQRSHLCTARSNSSSSRDVDDACEDNVSGEALCLQDQRQSQHPDLPMKYVQILDASEDEPTSLTSSFSTRV